MFTDDPDLYWDCREMQEETNEARRGVEHLRSSR
jgi:hypothetical protein